jgi:Tfp pilus assembly protein PilX|tara:strand:- start:370 stop:1047 length:678 start_codon:yes stop_codon:yes gene_type:complete
MKNKNEQGFALVLSLVLMLAMSLMGGALIVITAGDHQSNNTSDEYQQTFYVAETALLEGEKYVLNQYLGPWDPSTHARKVASRNLPANQTTVYTGDMTKKNYSSSDSYYYNTSTYCYNSFKDIDRTALKIVAAESWNFGKIIRDSFNTNASAGEQAEAEKLKSYYYEFFVTRIGAAPFRGYGSSIKKSATDSGNDGMAYRVYGCGIKSGSDRMIITLESTIVLPK